MSSTSIIDTTTADEAPGVWELARPATDHDHLPEANGDPRPEGEVDGYLTAVEAADELAGLEQDLAGPRAPPGTHRGSSGPAGAVGADRAVGGVDP